MIVGRTRANLDQRMERPQRHRLLHGYPLPRLMQQVEPQACTPLEPGTKPLLIGVLPHTFCNPKVRGCGFCTFPHERFNKALMKRVTAAVVREIATVSQRISPDRRTVTGLYFGGGTANLTPPDQFREICRALAGTFDLQDAEITLEGVPRYFLSHQGALIEILRTLGGRHHRLSMGVQTFDAGWQGRMGRAAFGDSQQIDSVLRLARAQDFTTSADILVNLPDDTEARIARDIHTAVDLGFDQVCIYNLVLHEGMSTVWAQDRRYTEAMPDRFRAFDNWRYARRTLLDLGYVQTTLTNFERADVARSQRRFTYERASFHPDQFDALGFGPAAISTVLSPNFNAGQKTINAATSAQYVTDIDGHGTATRQHFDYGPDDLRLLFITRSLPLLAICKSTYRSLFGSALEDDFPKVLHALQRSKLTQTSADQLRLTEKGMFYADAVAGTFASDRADRLRAHKSKQRGAIDEGAVHYHMG